MGASEVMSLMTALTPLGQSFDAHVPEPTLGTDDFDPEKHLNYKEPSRVHTMADLNLAEGIGVSPVAVSEPFQLFTEEAVGRMRAEVFSKNVWEKCQYSSNLAQCQLRGFAAK